MLIRLVAITALSLSVTLAQSIENCDRGTQLFAAGDLTGAELELRACLAIHPDRPESISVLGDVLERRQRPEEAITLYRRALELSPALTATRFHLAVTLYRAGEMEGAVEQLSVLKRQDPHDVRVARLLAECLIQQDHFGPAVQALLPVTGPEVHDPELLYLLATALTRDGQIGHARDAITRLLDAQDTAETRLMVAPLQLFSGDIDAALSSATIAAQRSASLRAVHYWRARALFESSDLADAERETRAELAAFPESAEATLLRGSILRRLGRASEALPFLERAASAKDATEAAVLELANALTDTAQAGQAVAMLENLTQHGVASADVYEAFAHAYEQLSRTADVDRAQTLALEKQTSISSSEAEGLVQLHRDFMALVKAQ